MTGQQARCLWLYLASFKSLYISSLSALDTFLVKMGVGLSESKHIWQLENYLRAFDYIFFYFCVRYLSAKRTLEFRTVFRTVMHSLKMFWVRVNTTHEWCACKSVSADILFKWFWLRTFTPLITVCCTWMNVSVSVRWLGSSDKQAENSWQTGKGWVVLSWWQE